MKIGVFGHKGMLGEAVVNAISKSEHSGVYTDDRIRDKLIVARVTDNCDVVINCLGRITPDNPIELIHSNSIVPHLIADQFKGPIIHVSTDKVFSGSIVGRSYYVQDQPNPTTMYGRSKLLGEVQSPHVTNVRTSFIGLKHGLLAWLIANRGGHINGWTRAFWSGSYANVVADGLLSMVGRSNRSIVHLCTFNPTTKHDLLVYLNEKFDLGITITPTDVPIHSFGMRPTIEIPSVYDSDIS